MPGEERELPKSRPVSLYDNFKEAPDINSRDLKETNRSTSQEVITNRYDGTNSSSNNNNVAWNTTVPINFSASKIAGRHTPTRTSLRHSRMIVLHRTGNIPRKSRTFLFRRRKVANILAALKTIFGVLVTSLSLWFFLWSPQLPDDVNSWWSGIPLLISGSFGVSFLCYYKKEYPLMERDFCLLTIKIISFILAITATVVCSVAFVLSTIHFVTLNNLECTSTNSTCACRTRSELASAADPVLTYLDLTCFEVLNIFKILLIVVILTNGLGSIFSGWYTYLHWLTRDKKSKYTKVQTNLKSDINRFDSKPIYNPNLNR